MESNDLEKSTNSFIASIFFVCTLSMIRRTKNQEGSGAISSKVVLIFPKILGWIKAEYYEL